MPPQGYAATGIEITDEKLTFEQQIIRRTLIVGTTTQAQVTVFYFDRFGRMDITLHGRGYIVRVWDAGDVYRFRVVISGEDRAHRFMDAMLVMSLRDAG
jgi:hypothetical protein